MRYLPILILALALIGCTADAWDRAGDAAGHISTAATQPISITLVPSTQPGVPGTSVSLDGGPLAAGVGLAAAGLAALLHAIGAGMRREPKTK